MVTINGVEYDETKFSDKFISFKYIYHYLSVINNI